MSLSDYISIFDTRPIAQSHLFEAATATLCAIYTGYTSIYTTRTNAYELRIATKHERRMYTTYRAARHGTAGTPHQAKPRHATPRRFAGPILCCPRGPLTLMLTPTLPPLPLAASIVTVRTCVYAYTVVKSTTKLERYVAQYTCADLRD